MMGCTIALLSITLLLAAPSLCGGADNPTRSIGVRESTTVTVTNYYPRLHALCIGINKYESEGIPSLSYAENDARDVAKVLREQYGFTDLVELLGADATRERIVHELSRLQDPDRVSDKDGVVIFFSGHGQTVGLGSGEQGYLLPVDAKVQMSNVRNPAPYRESAIRMDDLRADADAIPARHVLFLVDACYSGYMTSKAVEGIPEVASALRYPARQVITAGTKGEQAVEHNAWGHGAFSYNLLELLRSRQHPISASEIGAEIKKRVPREVAGRFADKKLSPQAKYLSGEGDFVLVPSTWSSVPDTDVPDDSALNRVAQDATQRQRLLEAAKMAYKKAWEVDESEAATQGQRVAAWKAYLDAYQSTGYMIPRAEERLAMNQSVINRSLVARVKDGCIYVADPDLGSNRQLTSTGLDSGPVVSPDGRSVAFVRRVPGKSVQTGMGETGETSACDIWLIGSDGSGSRRLVQSQGSQTPERMLADFDNLRFSSDGTTLYFLSTAFMTSSALHAVEIESGKERFICGADTLEIVGKGRYRGHLLVSMHRYGPNGAEDAYWLLTPEGKEVRKLSEDADTAMKMAEQE